MKASRLEQAISILNRSQAPSGLASHIGDIDPRALLVVTVVYLVAMLSVPVRAVGMLIWFATYPIITAPLAHLPYERVFMRSLYVLPLLVVIAVFNPLYDHRVAFMAGSVAVSIGWVSFASVLVRGLLSVQALLLLIHLTGFSRLCEAMRGLHVPRVLSTQLLMVYRYLLVLLQEALSMHRARQARRASAKAYRLGEWGAFVGQLLLRTMARSERIHRCMLARGFDGSLVAEPSSHWNTADTVYCFIWICVFIAMRHVNLSDIILRLV